MKTKKGFLLVVLEYVLEYVPTIATVLLATIVTLFTIRKSISTEEMLQWIIVVLALLATTQLIDRFRVIRRIDNKIETLIENTRGFGGGGAFFSSRKELDEREPFQQFLAQGHDIVMMGVSLVGTVGPLRTFFKSLANQGISLRFLLLNPNLHCLEFAAKSHGVSGESLRNDIMSSLMHLKQLADSVDRNKADYVQFRLLSTIPDSSIVMRDGNSDKGVIRCELYLYQADTTERPVFRLTTADSEYYYRYRDALNKLWNDSEVQNKPEVQNKIATE